MFRLVLLVAMLTLLALPSLAQQPPATPPAPPPAAQGEGTLWQNPHRDLIATYEGTKTCLGCHEQQGKDVFGSVHYQWKATAPNIVNAAGPALGKINTSNDFCTNPSISWIAILKNDQDKVSGNGCSKCHAGLGLKPAEDASRAQLENVDCLLCHAPGYKREVVKKEDASLAWMPVARNNEELMANLARKSGRSVADERAAYVARIPAGRQVKRTSRDSASTFAIPGTPSRTASDL